MAKRILHVDDDPIFLDLVRATFAGDPEVQIRSIRNAEDALTVLPDFKPDLIIADIALPNIGGFEFILRLREAPQTTTVPVIVLSGRARNLGSQNPFHQMAVVVLEKPVGPDMLRHEAMRLLSA